MKKTMLRVSLVIKFLYNSFAFVALLCSTLLSLSLSLSLSQSSGLSRERSRKKRRSFESSSAWRPKRTEGGGKEGEDEFCRDFRRTRRRRSCEADQAAALPRLRDRNRCWRRVSIHSRETGTGGSQLVHGRETASASRPRVSSCLLEQSQVVKRFVVSEATRRNRRRFYWDRGTEFIRRSGNRGRKTKR